MCYFGVKISPKPRVNLLFTNLDEARRDLKLWQAETLRQSPIAQRH
jgi:hypothetical protein